MARNTSIQRRREPGLAGGERRTERKLCEKQRRAGKVYVARCLVSKFSKLSFSCLRMQSAKTKFVFGAWLYCRKFWWTLARHIRSHVLDDRMWRRPQPQISVASWDG